MSLAALIPATVPETVRASQVAAWLSVDPRTLRHWEEAGKFPKPIKLGPRLSMYRTAEVRKALEEMEAHQSGDALPVAPSAGTTRVVPKPAKKRRGHK